MLSNYISGTSGDGEHAGSRTGRDDFPDRRMGVPGRYERVYRQINNSLFVGFEDLFG